MYPLPRLFHYGWVGAMSGRGGGGIGPNVGHMQAFVGVRWPRGDDRRSDANAVEMMDVSKIVLICLRAPLKIYY